MLRKKETPFGRCHSAVDPDEYYQVGGTRTCACPQPGQACSVHLPSSRLLREVAECVCTRV